MTIGRDTWGVTEKAIDNLRPADINYNNLPNISAYHPIYYREAVLKQSHGIYLSHVGRQLHRFGVATTVVGDVQGKRS
jgi:hypothetical protein